MSGFLAILLALQAPGPGAPAPRASQPAASRPQTSDAAGQRAPQSVPGTPPPQDPQAGAAQAAPSSASPPPVELPSFEGLADGLTKLQLAVGEQKTDVAVGLADALLAPNAWSRARTALETGRPWAARACDFVEPGVRAFGLAGPTSAARAEVHYAAGVAFDRGGAPEKARERFTTAAALAGPGALRLDASYNVGAIALGLAERLREAHQQAPPPGAMALQGPGQGPGHAGADPGAQLDQLEAAYRAAKLELVERLKADWHDADVRANLELIQRRLHEIEKQREELEKQKQEQKQQQQQQKPDQQQQDQQQQDSQKDDPQQSDQQPSDKQDPSSSNDERKDQEQQSSESKPDEQQQPGEEQQPKGDAQQKQDEQASEAKQDDSQDSKSQQPQPAQQEERVLTREELQRILGRLEEIEKEGQAIQARLRHARRASAEKDW